MATRGTGKTFEEFLEEAMESGKSKYNETEAKVRGDAEQNINNQNAVIDKAAQAKTSQYQKNIDEAPQRFAGAYDASYIDELVARKNLENTMADMGLTDSGLNRSQQTAISVMRGNADAKTRAQQNDYVTNLQDSIDQVLAQAEADKASYANQVNSSADSHLSQLWSAMEQNANSTAASRYKAQEESLDAIYKAELEAEAEAEKQRLEAIEKERDYAVKMLNAGYVQQQDGSWVKDNRREVTSDVATYAMKRMNDDPSLTIDDAMREGKILYGVATEEDSVAYAGKRAGYTGEQLNAYIKAGGGENGVKSASKVTAQNAASVVENISFEVPLYATLFRNKNTGDGDQVAKMVKSKLDSNSRYKAMNKEEQDMTVAYAIAKSVKQSWPNGSAEDNQKRIWRACKTSGVGDYDIALSFYNRLEVVKK